MAVVPLYMVFPNVWWWFLLLYLFWPTRTNVRKISIFILCLLLKLSLFSFMKYFHTCFYHAFIIFTVNFSWMLFQENDPTLMGRVKKSDAREMQSFYQHYYKKYIQALQNAADKADRWDFVNYSSFSFSGVYIVSDFCFYRG